MGLARSAARGADASECAVVAAGLSMSCKHWILPEESHPPDWEVIRKDWGIPSPVLCALWNRGLHTSTQVEQFLKPRIEDLHDPFLLRDCDRAVGRVHTALMRKEPILVFGDYDVDGISAATLWTRVLRRLGGTVTPLVPNRMEDGYGLSRRAVERAEAIGAGLLIANDCGTTAHDAISFANERSIDVVVCDHHMPESSLPSAYALVNPRRSDDTYPFPDMAAVGVAFKILQGLVSRHYGPEEWKYLLGQLDLVTLGTVADVVPLVGENRIFTHFGMKVLRVRRRPAFQALVEQARLGDRFLEASHLAFSLVPRINAAGRLGTPETALGLLLEDELDAARQLAGRLEEDNTARKVLNERVQADAFQWLAETPPGPGDAIVLGSADWHPGVLGIAASRLAARYRVPVFLVSLQGDVARGSARTPISVDLLLLLQMAGDHLVGFGGHRQAAGFSLDPARFPGFQQALLAACREKLQAPSEPSLDLDGALDPSRCNVELARWIERMGPFGEGNREPIYSGSGHCRSPRIMGERHLKMEVVSEGTRVECIGFGLGEFASEIPAGGGSFHLAFTPTVNRYRGQERVQLKLREIDFV